MKKTIKLLSVLLVMTMLVSTCAFAATFSDVSSDKNYYESVSVLSALGIINGYSDGTFGPEKNVTRAEFSAMLMRALASGGIGDPDPAGMPFVDLGDATWAISDIRTAYDLGIINGMSETTFEPNSNVTYEQALKMVVCALNYGEHALQIQSTIPNLPWYAGYMQAAGDLGLIDGVNYVLGQPAKRWEIAQIIYNAFDVYLLKKVEMSTGEAMYQQTTDTILNSKLYVARANGEIVADGPNTLAADGAVAREGYALVYDTNTGKTITYAKNGVSLDGLLGKSVEFFYKTDAYGERQFVYILNKGAEETAVTVSANNLYSVSGDNDSGFSVTYYISDESTRTNTIKLTPKAVVSVNGVVKSNPTAADFRIENGELEFINTNGKYTKVSISAIETYVVKSVNKTDRYIIDMLRPATGDQNKFALDYENGDYAISMKNSSGSEITINSLAAKNVLSVKTGQGAAGRIALDIEVSNKTATGIINEIDTIDRTINLGGTKYKLSQYLINYGSSVLSSLSTRDNCKVYLDVYDTVVYAEKIASTSTFYGYLAVAGEDKSDDTIKIGLVSSKASRVGTPYYTLANKVRINGKVCSSAAEILTELEAGANLPTANIDNETRDKDHPTQLIKYTLNSSGLVSDIEIAKPITSNSQIDETEFQAYTTACSESNKLTYNSSNYQFSYSDGTPAFRIGTTTEVYVVPHTRDSEDAYRKTTYKQFANNGEYVVEAYDVSGSMNVAKAVVLYKTATETTQSDLSHSSSLFLITEISQGIYKDVNRDIVKGYKITYTGEVTENATIRTETTNIINGKYEVGDVITYTANSDGYVTGAAKTLELLTSAESFVGKDYSKGSGSSMCQAYSGLLLAAETDGSEQMFEIAIEDAVADCATSTNVVSFRTDSSTKFFTYSKSGNNVEIIKHDDLDLTSYPAYRDGGDTPAATKIFVYRYGGTSSSAKNYMIYIMQ